MLLRASKSSPSSFDSYGDAAVDTVATKFTTTVVKERLQLKWMGFKHVLTSEFADIRPNEVIATLSEDPSFSSLYPTLSKLASISLTLHISTADCERDFSIMNRIKTDSRDRLKSTTLDMLIQSSSEGPRLGTFDFDAAVDVWAQKNKRRITV